MTTDLLDRLGAVPSERTAVLDGDLALTFGELRTHAGRIARRLAAHGVGPERVVALHLPRGADLLLALVGTLTAGAAYLPVDPKLPAERRRHLVADSGADLVIGPPIPGVNVPCLTPAELTAPGGPCAAYRPAPTRPDDLAYVIYTSGSTGAPKGVEITRGAAAALLAELEAVGIATTEAGRVGWNASPSFDASVQQWVRLCRGDTVVMIDEETRTDPDLFAALVADTGLTDLDITPSHAEHLLDPLAARHRPGAPPLTLLVGGEAISPALWARLAALAEAGVLRPVNVYGPTECTVDATAAWIAAADRPHLGAVLPGLSARLLDERLRPVGEGETGELYLAGVRVGRGYRNRPRLTGERFVADVAAADGSRMYRTGDRCRLLPGGGLEYLGRADGQVKVRGHRVEIGEIEAALTAHPAVAEAAVALREDGLVGYYRVAEAVSAAELREHLAARLAPYMVPAALVAVERFPTTPNGKLDRAALPTPVPDPVAAVPAGTADAAPLGPVEALIAAVWSEVLERPGITADDNFFKLGGHSLLAIKLVARVRADLGLRLPVRDVYQNPRLRDLAARIESALDRAPAPV
ncbi:non-ribosomal peptide synthetase [Actinocorallia sp. API 0066]|uniref:non-ribosomal peptide synthetase n=1 Tax=Actinocorallia sp. API 0066 TaxID=2896846 RepID=UPI001E2E514E|nr:non-ribosomal peptide synthetase [Actinocorallia sp. API 0066]MCD0449342.1 non-ribosomal peptide synthetase [Actinocorallia sp. API 0066]